MRKAAPALGLLLGLARGLAAFGGTSEPWLGGTLPWDTVPYFEMNLGARASGGHGRPVLGPFLEAGPHDQLMLGGAWDQPVDGSQGSGEAFTVLREAAYPRWRPALALSLRYAFSSAGGQWRPGLIAAVEPWDQSLVANVEVVNSAAALRFGYWSPYVVSFVRLGFEACSSDSGLDRPWRLLPQLTLQAPGDLSAVFGAQTSSQDLGAWSWALRFSWQLFPSP